MTWPNQRFTVIRTLSRIQKSAHQLCRTLGKTTRPKFGNVAPPSITQTRSLTLPLSRSCRTNVLIRSDMTGSCRTSLNMGTACAVAVSWPATNRSARLLSTRMSTKRSFWKSLLTMIKTPKIKLMTRNRIGLFSSRERSKTLRRKKSVIKRQNGLKTHLRWLSKRSAYLSWKIEPVGLTSPWPKPNRLGLVLRPRASWPA